MRVTANDLRFTRTVYEDQSRLCRLKYWRGDSAAGAAVTTATVQQAAANLTFLINGGAETVIGTYTGNSGGDNQIVYVDAAPAIGTVANLVSAINGGRPGHPTGANLYRRMRGSVGDFRPGSVIGANSGLVVAAANILLGDESDGLAILGDSTNTAVANLFSIGVGVPSCRRGTGPLLFDHFESDHVVTTAGVLTPQREAAAQQERFDAARFEVLIDSIHCGQTFGNNDNVIQVYDINNNLLWAHTLAALTDVPVNVLGPDQPIVGPMGSPLFVEAVGTGALTDGPMVVAGWIRRI